MFSIEGLMDSPAPTNTKEEATSNVQMEETGGDEAANHDEMSESKAAAEHAACDPAFGGASAAVNIESGHHNVDEELPTEYVHIMVDIETMGKKSNAPIVSIGAVLFDLATGVLGETFYKVVSLESAVSWGAEIDPSTVIWWLKQSSEARSAIANDDAIKLDDALLMFTDFVLENVTGGRKKPRCGVMAPHSITLFCVRHLISPVSIVRGTTGMTAMSERWLSSAKPLASILKPLSHLRVTGITRWRMHSTRPGTFLPSGSV